MNDQIEEYIDTLSLWLDKELASLPQENLSLSIMEKKPVKRTLCSVLRDIYHSAINEQTKQLSLEGMVHAKLLVGRLVQYRKISPDTSGIEYEAELDDSRLSKAIKRELKGKFSKTERKNFMINEHETILDICQKIKQENINNENVTVLLEEVKNGVRKIALKILFYKKKGVEVLDE